MQEGIEATSKGVEGCSESEVVRNSIMDFESHLKSLEGSVLGDSDLCPLKHSFSDGIYVREIFIPAGVVLAGKIHKHDHPNFLMSGEVKVFTESGGLEILKGPMSMISKAGTKRVVETITDTVWVTVHLNPTNTQDLSELEKEVIADSYEDYERFISGKKNIFIKGINYIKKLLR
jgi:hypothetical protein